MSAYGLVCNKGFEHLLAERNQFEILNFYDLHNGEEVLKNLKGIVVLAETCHQNLYFQDLNGLNSIRDLRLKHHLDVPVLIVSYVMDLNFEEEMNLIFNKQAPFNLLLDPSVAIVSVRGFLEACKEKKLPRLFPKPISDEILFEDIKKLYHPKEYLNELAHALRRKINDFPGFAQGKEMLKFIDDVFSEIQMIAPEQHKKIKQKLETWRAEIKENRQYDFLNNFARRLREELDDINHDIGLRFNPELKIPALTILNIDDDPVDQQKLAHKLKARFNIHCLIANNLDEARRELEMHPEIDVVVIDYRYYDQSKRFSRIQCHHIIEALSQFRNEPLNFILLTNYPESLSASFQKIYAGLPRFPKKILDDELLFFRFVQKIEEAAKITEAFRAEAFGLGMLFHKYYLAYRNHKEYPNFEERINKTTSDFLKKVANKAYDQLPVLPLQTKLIQSNNTFNLEMFTTKLIGRRVIISLLQNDEFWVLSPKGKKPNWSAMLNILLFRRPLIPGEKEIERNQQNQIINNNLSLKRKMNYQANIPINEMKILEEEKKWLQQFLNL